jgi:hypothetical protein
VELVPLITHAKYSKISDDIMFLGNNTILKMNVVFNYNTESFGKVSYHREYEYMDQKGDTQVSMKRTFDYYISIENTKNINRYTKEFIRIGMSEIRLVRLTLNNIIRWFNDPEFAGLYRMKGNKYILAMKITPISIPNLPMGKSLIFEPIVYEMGNGETGPGVRIYLSSTTNVIDLPLNRFMGFAQAMDDVNLFMCAQNMLNYLGRPEFGTNMHSFIHPDDAGGVVSRNNRQIGGNKKQGFDRFD